MIGVRFEYYENVVTKHHLNKVTWKQAALSLFKANFNNPKATVVRVRHLNNDQIELITRFDKNESLLFRQGFDQRNLYQRVIINRKEETVVSDRIDSNFWIDKPFLGRRDLFYEEENDEGQKIGKLAFVRHHFWLSKLLKFPAQSYSNFSSSSFKRSFKKEEK